MSDRNKPIENKEASELKFDRRDIVKGLATLPVLGIFYYKLWKKKALDSLKKQARLAELGVQKETPAVVKSNKPGELLRLGIIGYGGRGKALLRGAGFAQPEWVDDRYKTAQENKLDKGLETFLSQDDLNVVLTGVCDLFDKRAEEGIEASINDTRPGSGTRKLDTAKRYRDYRELLVSDEVDAVIIGAPDHWHAQIILDAVKAGKHVYCEKAMTRTIEEAHAVYKAVKNSGIVFQLGHQNRQIESHFKAKEIIDNQILGPVTLVQMTTNRNSPGGAWQYDIDPEGNPQTIDWGMFQKPSPNKIPFDAERFFRWRKWYDYGTGLAGDLLSHEFDAVNQIMDLGIPSSAVASGGIYYFKDGRDVPDVFQVAYEYPERDLTAIYSATLSSGKNRGRLFMGHDAYMEVGRGLTVTPDSGSTRYRSKIDEGLLSTALPLFTYTTGSKQIDGVTSATAKYFAERGLLYSYRGGKRVSSTHLHIADWIYCIRNGGEPQCNIDRGFEEAIACHMATKSYQEGRKVIWDPIKREVI
ncbi:MAG: Gfo/Idh/MocA family oxidoreductase [Candidatus Marinimicrobia bacterium]|nr:Gfo/Idh/MocA family oxidoreductase [Candidatus Neomarinimicrobiota bacterium]